MTRRNVTDEQYGRLCRRAGELLRRVDEGTLGFDQAMDSLQTAIEGIFHSIPGNWAVWKTIQLGTGLKTADEFRRAMKGGGFRISNWANDIIGKSSISSEKAELDLAVVTVAELGFLKGATRKEIYERARLLGLELCPPEAGSQLRLQYRDQPAGEWLFIAMHPIEDSDGGPSVFHVERLGGVLWLGTRCDYPGLVWDPDYRWVFALRK
ncbi:hypothetical protein KKC83_04475 [Patescibacteria group bacterium]|nr:hypothetical protein [Candidatus Falkowbacteria bacterium]MBU3906381.1 hypothetical protein [Patescibacteria group bacterium]MBU4015455.1 hypothetical protein [Patescibacteria group bacterium]MBU4026771.1 hypothetical protein [Patescibacteria group bacterium]MBU4072565.1 hypothetical protein [Patescibacteria group bacterium]